MDKDKEELSFDFDNDEEFHANFYKNLETVLGDSEGQAVSDTEGTQEVEAQADVLPEHEDTVDDENHEQESDEEMMYEASEDTPEKISDEQPDGTENDTTDAATDETAAAASSAEEIAEEDNEEDNEEVDDELVDINNELASQISAELDALQTQEQQGAKSIFFKLQNGIVLTILCLLGFGFFFGFTKPGNNLLMDMGINIGGMIWDARTKGFVDNTDVDRDIDYIEEDDINSSGKEIDVSTIKMPNNSVDGRREEGVFNILLLGEEAIGQGAGRGRTDVMVVATLNTNDNTIKLTSLLRDQLVKIPEFKDNKLNVAYEEGGIDLLYDTVAINFDLHIDGSVLVNFKYFEKIVDKLGGLEITLTASEAKYLNRTNYISNPLNRKVVEGKQLMNGNQVLGYCRVRKRPAITGKNNDYGRTDRHRIVLNAIFDKCKNMNKAQLATLMYEFLPMITTDIDKKVFEALLDAFIKTGAKEIQQLRIPVDGTFDDDAKVRGMAVLIPDYDKNIEILHEFIFGNKATATTGN